MKTIFTILLCLILWDTPYRRVFVVGSNLLTNYSHRKLVYQNQDSLSLLGIWGLQRIYESPKSDEIMKCYDLGNDVSHNVNTYFQEDIKDHQYLPQLTIRDSVIYLDTLTQKNCVTEENIGNIANIELTDEYILELSNKTYLILKARHIYPCMNCNPHYWLVFGLHKNKIMQMFSFYAGGNEYPFEQTFGDFDNNGSLDFLEEVVIDDKNIKINYYSVVDDKFIRNKNFFLILKIKNNKNYVVTEQSKWFFDLSKK